MSDLAELRRETRSSIEVTRNRDGGYQWSIKRYYDQDRDGELEEAEVQLSAIDTFLCSRFLVARMEEVAP
jgi:hypothetical protein